jgi:hypothetical protein
VRVRQSIRRPPRVLAPIPGPLPLHAGRTSPITLRGRTTSSPAAAAGEMLNPENATWADILELAERYGWQPTGTGPAAGQVHEDALAGEMLSPENVTRARPLSREMTRACPQPPPAVPRASRRRCQHAHGPRLPAGQPQRLGQRPPFRADHVLPVRTVHEDALAPDHTTERQPKDQPARRRRSQHSSTEGAAVMGASSPRSSRATAASLFAGRPCRAWKTPPPTGVSGEAGTEKRPWAGRK